MGVPFLIMLTIFLIGVFLIAKGTGPLVFYKKQKGFFFKDKIDLDRICKLYDVEYNIEFKKNKNSFEQNLLVKSLEIKKLK